MPYKDPEAQAEWNRRYNNRPEVKARAKAWKAAHPDKLKEYQATHYAAHATERNAASVESAKAPHRKAAAKGYRLLKKGWSQERYVSTLYRQNGSCAICMTPFDKTPQADHAHTDPPIPRGLLCSNCNTGLGLFRDRPELLEAAAQYLKKF
jgi:hypothetical protein